jgi:predicted AAA+ superfamily ATPase
VSQLLIDGIVGKRFAKTLSFYLDRSEEYLNVIEKMAQKPCGKETARWSGGGAAFESRRN